MLSDGHPAQTLLQGPGCCVLSRAVNSSRAGPVDGSRQAGARHGFAGMRLMKVHSRVQRGCWLPFRRREILPLVNSAHSTLASHGQSEGRTLQPLRRERAVQEAWIQSGQSSQNTALSIFHHRHWAGQGSLFYWIQLKRPTPSIMGLHFQPLPLPKSYLSNY